MEHTCRADAEYSVTFSIQIWLYQNVFPNAIALDTISCKILIHLSVVTGKMKFNTPPLKCNSMWYALQSYNQKDIDYKLKCSPLYEHMVI